MIIGLPDRLEGRYSISDHFNPCARQTLPHSLPW
jgi:hypothetical protein